MTGTAAHAPAVTDGADLQLAEDILRALADADAHHRRSWSVASFTPQADGSVEPLKGAAAHRLAEVMQVAPTRSRPTRRRRWCGDHGCRWDQHHAEAGASGDGAGDPDDGGC